jgi:SRSO17 transposase
VGSATKPQLALAMLARAHDAGVLHGWVTVDEAFGQNRAFRSWLAAREVPFVLATRSEDSLTCPDGSRHQASRRWPVIGHGSAARPVSALDRGVDNRCRCPQEFVHKGCPRSSTAVSELSIPALGQTS